VQGYGSILLVFGLMNDECAVKAGSLSAAR